MTACRKSVMLLLGLGLACVVAGGCGAKQAPIVKPPSPQSQIAQIEASPNLTPIEKQNFIEGIDRSAPKVPARPPQTAPK